MLKRNSCIMKKGEHDNKFSACLQLSVVDEAKTDMEYNCFSSVSCNNCIEEVEAIEYQMSLTFN